MKWYGIYINDTRIWGRFKTEEQAWNFIETYDLENIYQVKSYQKGVINMLDQDTMVGDF